MYIDPILVQAPEGLEKERFIIATYYLCRKAQYQHAKVRSRLSCGTDLRYMD